MRRNTSQRLEPYLGVPCFFVTFFLIGIWHGRTSEFVVFGFLTGAGMSLNQLWQIWLKMKLGRKDYKTLAARSAYAAPSRGLSITWFAFTLFWFWADWQQIGHIAGALNWTQWLAVWLAVWLALTVATATWEWLRAKLLEIRTENGPLLSSRYALVVYATTLGLLGFVFTAVLNQPTPAIVYKAF
jgi:D-alanyl-lipoteichoic acid acyltransferase DltB (MBOAT superfamily)